MTILRTPFPILPNATSLPGGMQVLGLPGAEIGDKMRMLAVHADTIRGAGFELPHRVVLAEDRMNMILAHNGFEGGLQDADLTVDNLGVLKMPPQVQEEIRAVSGAIRDSYGDTWIAIRSSTRNDARGTGVYRSHHIKNAPALIGQEIDRVLQSYFSESAKEWRARNGAPPGFAIGIEPTIAQRMAFGAYTLTAPLVSGMGYSSSGAQPGFIKIAYGRHAGSGAKLSRAVLSGYDYSARRYMEAATHSQDIEANDVDPAGMYMHARDEFAPFLDGISYEPIIAGLEAMESGVGMPVYIEFAVTAVDGIQRNYMLQFAMVPPQSEIWKIGAVGSIFLMMTDVRRGRPLDINAVVFLDDRHQLDGLAAFNAENSAFLLVFGRSVMGSIGMRQECPLEMVHVSNASAMMMDFDAKAGPDWEEHLRGLAEGANIMIGGGCSRQHGREKFQSYGADRRRTRSESFAASDENPLWVRNPIRCRHPS